MKPRPSPTPPHHPHPEGGYKADKNQDFNTILLKFVSRERISASRSKMCKILEITRSSPSIETDAPHFSISKTFNIQVDSDVEEMCNILELHGQNSTGIRIEVQCYEEDSKWFTPEYIILPSLYTLPSMLDFAQDMTSYCRLRKIPCWLTLTMW